MAIAVAGAVSAPRLSAFGLPLAPTDADTITAVARHAMNITLCEALYPSLHLLELAMRNRIHDAFSSHFGVRDWYTQPWLLPRHRDLVDEAKATLLREHKPDTPDRVVAELSFGFWCGMFSPRYSGQGGPWPDLLGAVIPHVSKRSKNTTIVAKRIEDARKLRNRVFHHEPIGQYVNLRERHRQLVELVGWFSLEARLHLQRLCRFNSVLAERLEFA
jgi:hypothetical protein